VDDIIMFKPLSRNEILEIVKLQFEQLKKMLAQNEMQLTITDEALAHLATLGYDPQYGARPVKRVMQREMLNELSKIILSGKIDKEKPIQVDVADAKLKFVNA
ncbi:MAG: type VI secretion system ATPase TssH, partial [Bacteroidales bacterium]|nr:type VI secretion system ATPase TssH [Bacteroidales bacterium]